MTQLNRDIQIHFGDRERKVTINVTWDTLVEDTKYTIPRLDDNDERIYNFSHSAIKQAILWYIQGFDHEAYLKERE